MIGVTLIGLFAVIFAVNSELTKFEKIFVTITVTIIIGIFGLLME